MPDSLDPNGRIRQRIDQLVDDAPPFDEQQAAHLRFLLRPDPPDEPATS